MQKRRLEKLSSAVTLSDMEIFIFPELMIAGAIANIMSPVIWEWKNVKYFQGIERLTPYRRILRVKQYIMDNYVFNLDLDTWGLTTKETEKNRFCSFIDMQALEQSNALFGYEGDKYYFDIDIRRHFGLDAYDSEAIPYWKTETVEAMNAFRLKEGYHTGAGECVSLSLLYCAALFIVAKIPLEDIYMMATPLHSQNFVTVNEGIITNNRRIVTKSMWSNGTPMSHKARRALQNERVSIVANLNGYVHSFYPEATMKRESYSKFSTKLSEYLTPNINHDHFLCFLRHFTKWQDLFQFYGKTDTGKMYIVAEELYNAEADSELKLASSSISKLINRIKIEKLSTEPYHNRILLQDYGNVFQKLNKSNRDNWEKILSAEFKFLGQNVVSEICQDLYSFSFIEPKLPSNNEDFVWKEQGIDLTGLDSREQIFEKLTSLKGKNELADLAFMAYRDISGDGWEPFLMAALCRNPASIEGSLGMSNDEVYNALKSFQDSSIYSDNRLSQPDEVWNFKTGDGFEKALCMMNILSKRGHFPEIAINGDMVKLICEGIEYKFITNKTFDRTVVMPKVPCLC